LEKSATVPAQDFAEKAAFPQNRLKKGIVVVRKGVATVPEFGYRDASRRWTLWLLCDVWYQKELS
jgi:hypothetical protein